MEENVREKDRKDFVRLATKRVNNALRYIRLIGNLSNTSNYYYNEEDVQKIFTAIRKEVDECQERFGEKKKQKASFSLDD